MPDRHAVLTLPGRAHLYVETFSTGPDGEGGGRGARASLTLVCRGSFTMLANVVKGDMGARVLDLSVHGPAEQSKLLSALERAVKTLRDAGVQPATADTDPVPTGLCVRRSSGKPGRLKRVQRADGEVFVFTPLDPLGQMYETQLEGVERQYGFREPDCTNPTYCARERGHLDPCSTRGCLHSRDEG